MVALIFVFPNISLAAQDPRDTLIQTLMTLVTKLNEQNKLLLERIESLQEATVIKADEDKEDEEEKETLTLTTKANGLHDVQEELVLADFKVSRYGDNDYKKFSADVTLNRVHFDDSTSVVTIDPENMTQRCSRNSYICKIEIEGLTKGDYEYVIKNVQLDTYKLKDIITGTFEGV